MNNYRKIAEKDTGNYDVRLVELDDEYLLLVKYIGMWAGGDFVEVVADVDAWVEKMADPDSDLDSLARRWFKWEVTGDLDVAGMLEREGYDIYTNRRRR